MGINWLESSFDINAWLYNSTRIREGFYYLLLKFIKLLKLYVHTKIYSKSMESVSQEIEWLIQEISRMLF